VIKWAALGVAGFVLVLLSSLNGLFVQPFAPWWFGQQSTFSVTPQPTGFTVSTPTLVPGFPTPTPGSWQDVGKVINQAYTWLGVPYAWGGCSRTGVDCSCLMVNVFHAVGINLPRTTTSQVQVGTPVDRSQIQAGDLVFFDNTCTNCGANPTHVGLSIGGGLMIDAGDPVQVNSITTGFYASHFDSARRVIP
jgi:cell wall-associated NlpC family hydrolase